MSAGPGDLGGVPRVGFGRNFQENRAEHPQPDCLRVARQVENGHETAFKLVSGAKFVCVLHHLSGPTRLKESRGQVRPEIGQKPKIRI